MSHIPPNIKNDRDLVNLLYKVVDDIGNIYMPDSHAQAIDTWQLLVKEKLNHWDRFKLITRYVGNGGNPLILARWLYAYGSLGNPGNVKDACGILKRIAKNTLNPADKRDSAFRVYQWTHKTLVGVPVAKIGPEDQELFDEAIETLHGVHGNAAKIDSVKMRDVPLDARWRYNFRPIHDMFGFENMNF